MSKILITIIAVMGIFCSSIEVGAAMAIPYPPDYDTKTEGASAAPPEINHQASVYFKHLDFYNMHSNENLTLLANYRTYQQTTEYTCGPAAALTVLDYFNENALTELELAVLMESKPYPVGTSVEGMVKGFTKIGWLVESSLEHEQFSDSRVFASFVLENLRNNTPIMVENIEWGGHWRVIIGYDTLGTETELDDILIMMDSYDICDHLQDGYTVVNKEKFFSMWFDHSMLPENERSQPWLTARPK